MCFLLHVPQLVHIPLDPLTLKGIAAFEEGTFLPLPSQQAVERSIGKGGNGTISIVYFKGVEFAVKRVRLCACTNACAHMRDRVPPPPIPDPPPPSGTGHPDITTP